MNSPFVEDEACALCRNHKTPEDLNLHITEEKTCADVHLELALINAVDNKEKCINAQNEYRSICCQTKSSIDSVPVELKVSAAAISGALLVWFVTKKVFSMKIGVEESKDGSTDYKSMKDTPVKKKKSKQKQKSVSKQPKSKSKEPKKEIQKSAEGVQESLVPHVMSEEDTSMLAMWNGNMQ